MKAKVLKDFIDKNTRLPYRGGDIYENEDEARMAFLHEAGYLSEVEAKAPVEPDKEPPADPKQGEPAADTNDGGKGGKGGKGSKGDKKDKAAGEEK